MNYSAKSVFWKVVIIWLVFAVLHFAHGVFPHPWLAFLGEAEGRESIWGHSKMNFYTYLIVTIGEFFIFRRKIAEVGQFWFTRLLSCVIYPWLALTFWMTGSAVYGSAQPPRGVELTVAMLANVFGAYLTIRLEQVFDTVRFRPATRWTILLFFLLALFQYIAFELQTPWWDFFLR